MCRKNALVFIILSLLLKWTAASKIDYDKYSYNPDQDLDTAQIIARHGYPSETHTITTEDGYILKVFRIPGPKRGARGGQPILLQHGLLSSSSDWIINGNNSLGFHLADKGYDVWLGNARGNSYSKGHVSFPVDSDEFWDFSWHEMGVYDLPAVICHIGKITRMPNEIIYIGHSMGTTMFFVFSSLLPNLARRIKLMVALAPVAYMTHITSPIRYLAPFSTDAEWLIRELGVRQFLPNNRILRLLSYECELLHYSEEICENLILLLCGYEKKEFNEDLLPMILSVDPAGTSTKTVIHYGQEINGGNFQEFDYGSSKNLVRYGTPYPPKYNVTNINRPVYLMYADNDALASSIDVKALSKKLKNLIGVYEVPMKLFNHIDFLFGKHVYKLVYEPLMELIEQFTY